MIGTFGKFYSSAPGAFAALGVGAVMSSAIMISAISIAPMLPDIDKPDIQIQKVHDIMGNSLLIAMAFVSVFLVYAFGLVSIYSGSLVRRSFAPDYESQRIAYIVHSRNGFLKQLFSEAQRKVAVSDGMMVSLAFLFFAFGISVSAYMPWAGILLGIGGAASNGAIFFIFSARTLQDFDDILDAYLEFEK